MGYSTDSELDRLEIDVPEKDSLERAFVDFPRAIWHERSKRTKDARRGAWHCEKCNQPLALSFSDYGEPLWISAKTEVSNAQGAKFHIVKASATANPTGQDAVVFSRYHLPALAKCLNPACRLWTCLPREARKTGSKEAKMD